jgi:hypothetical protein
MYAADIWLRLLSLVLPIQPLLLLLAAAAAVDGHISSTSNWSQC